VEASEIVNIVNDIPIDMEPLGWIECLMVRSQVLSGALFLHIRDIEEESDKPWFRVINTDDLDLGSPFRCIGGQMDEEYSAFLTNNGVSYSGRSLGMCPGSHEQKFMEKVWIQLIERLRAREVVTKTADERELVHA
jgi:hypothetical protein